MIQVRESGILLHISSLPSPGGIGCLGQEAYDFADFLQASGMRIWQVLPVGPTGYGESPYQSTSVYAGNPLLISCDKLRDEGLLTFDDSEQYSSADDSRVNYENVCENKMKLLKRSFDQSADKLEQELNLFRKNQPWVEDFALFTAVKNYFGQIMWSKWPDKAIRFREPDAVAKYRDLLKDDIHFHIYCQYIFRKQWLELKTYCNERSIQLFGDMPIYVAEDSSDTWTHPEVFQLDRDRIPKKVAGVPPDYFSEDGQLWGNPLYRWHWLKRHGYKWWVDRMKVMSTLYDLIRIDHFIGFANFYSVKYGMPNARIGKWIKGPGKSLFRKLTEEIPDIKIIAEDLGCVNRRVRKLLDWCGYPGMKVLTFGFDSDESNPHFIGNYSANCVAYTGTHDNDTTLGWAQKASEDALAYAKKTLHFSDVKEAPAAFINALFSSQCDRVVIPMQDVLELDSNARMNYPGTVGGNWVWRMKDGSTTADLAMKLYYLNKKTDRS